MERKNSEVWRSSASDDLLPDKWLTLSVPTGEYAGKTFAGGFC